MGKGSVLGWGSLLRFIFLLYIKRSGSMLFAVFLMEKGNKKINKKITIRYVLKKRSCLFRLSRISEKHLFWWNTTGFLAITSWKKM